MNTISALASSSSEQSVISVFLIIGAALDIPLAVLGFLGNMILFFPALLYKTITSNLGSSIAISMGISTLMAGLLFAAIFLFIKVVRTGESER